MVCGQKKRPTAISSLSASPASVLIVGFKIDCCLNLDNDDAVELDDELLIELVGLQIL